MAAGAAERSRRSRPGSRPGAQEARAGRVRDSLRAARLRRSGSGVRSGGRRAPASGAPAREGRAGGAARGAARAERPGRRARGGAHAGLRGEARGPGQRIRCSRRPPRPRAPAPGWWRGSPGGAAPGLHPQRARRRPRWYSGRVRNPDLPADRGARARPPPPAGSPAAGPAGVWRPSPPPGPLLPGSLAPPPRPDPAAKGWAGKRALWDRCQLRDKRHKIGGNGGRAAGALGRGPRRRGGRIRGADPGKFGKSPPPLLCGGGRAARAALRAAPRSPRAAPLLNNSWRGRRPLACTGRAARLCQAAAAFGARATAPGLAVSPRPPAPRRPLCPRRRPGPALADGRVRRVRARGARAPARDAPELGQSSGARPRGPAAGALSVSAGTKVPAGARADAGTGHPGPLGCGGRGSRGRRRGAGRPHAGPAERSPGSCAGGRPPGSRSSRRRRRSAPGPRPRGCARGPRPRSPLARPARAELPAAPHRPPRARPGSRRPLGKDCGPMSEHHLWRSRNTGRSSRWSFRVCSKPQSTCGLGLPEPRSRWPGW
ncbi:basic proline-rich protein-like [Dipodomys merriami]|uniref:basic proline-rich protein-like n=1 Tax=Dipodomys merriami TaxID=94247 RepID=UPI0038556BAD